MDLSGHDSQQKGPRQLLPSSRTAIPRSAPIPPKRAPRVAAACEPCRSRKTRCDGYRPECGECTSRNTDCHYRETETRQIRRRFEQLQERRSAHEDLLEMLRTMPEKDALNIFHRIRAGESTESIVRQVQEGSLLMELSTAPSACRPYEFPYNADMPQELLTPGNEYLYSTLYHWIQAAAHSETLEVSQTLQASSPVTRPMHAAEMVDPLLAEAKPSQWTNVSANDRLMRELLHSYFVNVYPLEFIFYKNHFLEDMLAGSTASCSHLLVNALLAKACTTSRMLPRGTKFWDPDTLAYRFLAEAKRLWELEVGEEKLTTIQAGYLIHAAMNADGYDTLGLPYTHRALEMAHRIELFKSQKATDSRFEHAKAFTARGIACWQTSRSYHYFEPPLFAQTLSIQFPDVISELDWYGEIWLHYSGDAQHYPMGAGHGMKALIELRIIVNDICVISFGKAANTSAISWEQAIQFRSRLAAWHDSLPDIISAKMLLFPSHLKLHCEYHSILIMLFNSQLAFSSEGVDSLTNGQRFLAQRIVAQAKIRLETLLRIYYLRHSYESYGGLLVAYLTQLGMETLVQLSQLRIATGEDSHEQIETRRSLLLLCLKGIHDQSKVFHLAAIIFNIMKHRLSSEDRDILGQHIALNDGENESKATDIHHPVISGYVMPIVNLHDDPTLARLSSLARSTASLLATSGAG